MRPTCNPGIRDGETDGERVGGQLGMCRETLFHNSNGNKTATKKPSYEECISNSSRNQVIAFSSQQGSLVYVLIGAPSSVSS